MKNVICIAIAVCAAAAFAAEVKLQDMRPEAQNAPAAPTGAEWQASNAVALAEATADARLIEHVATADAANALLARLKGAYRTDPVVAFTVGAVSQWTMGREKCFSPSPAEGRRVWTEALLARASAADADDYVRMFCLDQLRWCGYACPAFAAKVRAAGATASRPVREFCAVVANELEGRAIGR